MKPRRCSCTGFAKVVSPFKALYQNKNALAAQAMIERRVFL
jgi:hypothetical protein